ncbi:hypothetical protein J2I47_09075 [Fibrella sp. HMF5335]|uniref:Uncharacterized protein n=1 Tax=Fibrella rubiginis TaxID=2817060 RepID=A0A939GD05_9BACT|nr:hypothetical protein [Fibrella rubiginis]MBO0936694.1 hypothetical protein [Fibrella rubiginis]
MADQIDYHKALLNGESNKRGQRKSVSAVRPINTHEVIELLKLAYEGESTHGVVRRAAKDLLIDMTAGGWQINAPQHTGGRPDDPDPDDNLHITIRSSGFGGCHIRLTRDGYIRQITLGRADKTVGKPWQATGTPHS